MTDEAGTAPEWRSDPELTPQRPDEVLDALIDAV